MSGADERMPAPVAAGMTRRSLLGAVGIACGAALVGAGAGLVRPGTAVAAALANAAIWDDYRADPDRHPNLPNVSYAGYRRGEKALPSPAVVANVKSHGAKGDGTADDTAAINAAIEAAADAGGGAVLLPAGTYRITGIIRVHHSNVVLRGEGVGTTTIYAEESLYDCYFPNERGELVQWSFMGGLVWFVPKSHLDQMRADDFQGVEGWRGSTSRGSITGTPRRGDRTLTLTAGTSAKAGDVVLVCADNVSDSSLLKHLCGAVAGTASYAWNTKAERLRPERTEWTGAVNYTQLRYPVTVKSVSGTTVTLAEPLRFDLRPEWKPRLTTIGETIRESGIENLTVRMRETPQPTHNKEHGFNGPCFQNAIDCWARNVRVENVDNGFSLISAKNVTIVDATVAGRYAHHPFMARVQADDNLIANFTVLSTARHGVNSEGFAFGNVWAEGVMKHGTFDSHKAIPADSVRTAITITNDGGTGGASDAGPIWGRRMAMWNIDVQNSRSHGIRIESHAPYSAVVGVRGTSGLTDHAKDFSGDVKGYSEAGGSSATPADLYLAQYALRTGSSSPQVRATRGAKA